MNRQFVYFVLTGGLAACVNFVSRILLNVWLPYSFAIIVAYLFGMVTAFMLNKLLVFRDTNNALHHQIFWFCIVNLAAVLQTLAVSLLLADIAFPKLGFYWYPETVAHGIGVLVPVVTSFLGHKHLTFRTR
jgi:putative flippase GtrA